MPPDEFDTIIQAVSAGWPHQPPTPLLRPVAATGPRHPVLDFAQGTFWWLANAILVYVLVWLLLHS